MISSASSITRDKVRYGVNQQSDTTIQFQGRVVTTDDRLEPPMTMRQGCVRAPIDKPCSSTLCHGPPSAPTRSRRVYEDHITALVLSKEDEIRRNLDREWVRPPDLVWLLK